MCNVAEQAAEAARACAASSRIGKRVCELGSGGWGVLCDCAQTVLRTSRAASSCVLRVGHSGMKTPSHVTETLDSATGRKLGKRGEREIRGFMEAILASVREGRSAANSASLCSEKAADGAQIVLSLIRLPPNPERLASAVGSEALCSLMARVADVLAEMATAVGVAAEHAMSTAVAVEAMHRQSKLVSELSEGAEAKDDDPSSSSGESSDEDEDVKAAAAAAKKAAAEEEARRKEAEAAEQQDKDNGEDLEANLRPEVKARLANARLLRKLSAEVREAQVKLRELVVHAPHLVPGVTVTQKEEMFQQLADLLAAAEQPIAQRWYEAGPPSERAELSAETAAVADAEEQRRIDEWVGFVHTSLDFLFHAADVTTLPVPASLGARLLRASALVDAELVRLFVHAPLTPARHQSAALPLPLHLRSGRPGAGIDTLDTACCGRADGPHGAYPAAPARQALRTGGCGWAYWAASSTPVAHQPRAGARAGCHAPPRSCQDHSLTLP